MAFDSSVTDPQGAMIIWNYKNRLSSTNTKDVGTTDHVFIPTTSVISMQTSKQKSSPAGSFQVELAPTFNWVSRITPGSWCVILMSRETRIEDLKSVGNIDERTFRMLGRIESVRLQYSVNQETGARQQRYVVTGVDWGSVFNTILYIDQIGVNNLINQDANIGQSLRILFNDQFQTLAGDPKGPPTTTEIMQGIINLWGTPLPDITDKLNKANIAATSEAQYTLPSSVTRYMNLESRKVPNLPKVLNEGAAFASLINLYVGPLKQGYDKYPSVHEGDAQGIPEPNSFQGKNSFWGLLQQNSNPILNEMIADVRFEGGETRGGSGYDASRSKPTLALYKRVRPFTMTEKIEGDKIESNPNNLRGVKNNLSYFKNVRRIPIPLNDIVNVSAGTNWRDKVNYIEIYPRIQNLKENYDAQLKNIMQTVDRQAYQREGFKPLMETAVYTPYTKGSKTDYQFKDVLEWRYLLRDWHFNTHLTLNGSVSFAGIDRYIQVGDNIMFDARAVGLSQNFSERQLDNRLSTPNQKEPNQVFFTAHVEGVSHSFGVSPVGARTFTTSVSFVRGVFTDAEGNLVGFPGGGTGQALDQDASLLSHSDERHSSSNTITDLGVDPDKGGFKTP